MIAESCAEGTVDGVGGGEGGGALGKVGAAEGNGARLSHHPDDQGVLGARLEQLAREPDRAVLTLHL